MPVNLDLDLIKARLAAATPGPWVLSKDRETITQTSHITRDVWTIPRTHEDMELIAHAPSDLAALIAELKRVTEKHDRLHERLMGIERANVDSWKDGYAAAQRQISAWLREQGEVNHLWALEAITRGDHRKEEG